MFWPLQLCPGGMETTIKYWKLQTLKQLYDFTHGKNPVNCLPKQGMQTQSCMSCGVIYSYMKDLQNFSPNFHIWQLPSSGITRAGWRRQIACALVREAKKRHLPHCSFVHSSKQELPLLLCAAATVDTQPHSYIAVNQ